MADALTLTSPTPRRRGRPPGSGNKRSLDLAKYVAATFGGQTPGQQAAAVSMVTPAELKRARAAARELGLVDLDLSPLMLAMVVKAHHLATAIGCETRDAWLLMAKEREALMPYIHQKLPAAPEPKDPAQLPQVFLIPGEAPPAGLRQVDEGDQARIEFMGEIDAPPPKSHG